MGKSRLTQEFLVWLEGIDPAPRTMRGRCLPYGDGITYWPLAEILKSTASVLDTDPPDLALEKIAKVSDDVLTDDVTSDRARTTAALAYTVGVEDPAFRFGDMDPREVRVEIHAAWRSFFSALGAAGPTIAIVEDIHWADAALLDLLDELAEGVTGSVVFLCPARPELTLAQARLGRRKTQLLVDLAGSARSRRGRASDPRAARDRRPARSRPRRGSSSAARATRSSWRRSCGI